MKTIFTTAPVDYDYGYVKVIEACAAITASGIKRTYRRVEIPEDRVAYQCGRYQSGMHAAIDSREFAKLIDYGLVVTRHQENRQGIHGRECQAWARQCDRFAWRAFATFLFVVSETTPAARREAEKGKRYF